MVTIINTLLVIGCYNVCVWYSKYKMYRARNKAIITTVLLMLTLYIVYVTRH